MELKKVLSDLDSMDVDRDPVAFTRQVSHCLLLVACREELQCRTGRSDPAPLN
jgi:hypothetical protein